MEALVHSYLPGGANVPSIPLNHPCAAAMRPVVKLLWPLVYSLVFAQKLTHTSLTVMLQLHVYVHVGQVWQCGYS